MSSLLASRKRYEATRELAACRVRPSSMVASDPDVAAALAGSGVSSSSKDPEQGEKKSSFFSSGSSSAKKSDAERGAVTAGEEGDGMAVQITDIYSEPIHSLAQQQRPLLAKVAAGQSAGSDVEV